MITVANIRRTKNGEYIGRSMRGLRGSPLGNPYKIQPGQLRDEVIALYAEWLDKRLASDTPQRREMERLAALARQGELVLLCWCAPLGCHGDIVKARIEAMLEVQP